MIARAQYLQQLISKKGNGLVKVITGIRGCGKTILLFGLYYQHLRSLGVDEDHIIRLALDDDALIRYRNPIELGSYIRSLLVDKDKTYYIFLDEIRMVETIKNPYLDQGTVGFVDVLLGLMKKKNADVYVTGSNSKMLSSDVLTQFRGRGDEVRVHPLSFAEFRSAYEGDKRDAWREYRLYGGMPYVLSLKSHREKSEYLKGLLHSYLKDIREKRKLRHPAAMKELLDLLASSVGALTSHLQLANALKADRHVELGYDAVGRYADHLLDAFVLRQARRYDVKAHRRVAPPLKYYFEDIGLRNALLDFQRLGDEPVMENILYNELLIRGFDVDVGVVEYNYKDADGKSKKTNLGIDFVANDCTQTYYVQSAPYVGEEEKRLPVVRPYKYVPDSFKKLVVVKDSIIPWRDEQGILYMGIEQFLLDPHSMDL